MKKKRLIIFAICSVILFFCVFLIFCCAYPKKYKSYVLSYSNEYSLEPALVYAIIKAESDFNKNAVSKSGAIGLMQLLPSTANWISEILKINFVESDLFKPEINIRFGCFYLNYLFKKFKNLNTVVCAYNAGEGKIEEWLNEEGVLEENKIDYLETRQYLKNVLNYYKVYNNKYLVI